jgi:hypothetical protein
VHNTQKAREFKALPDRPARFEADESSTQRLDYKNKRVVNAKHAAQRIRQRERALLSDAIDEIDRLELALRKMRKKQMGYMIMKQVVDDARDKLKILHKKDISAIKPIVSDRTMSGRFNPAASRSRAVSRAKRAGISVKAKFLPNHREEPNLEKRKAAAAKQERKRLHKETKRDSNAMSADSLSVEAKHRRKLKAGSDLVGIESNPGPGAFGFFDGFFYGTVTVERTSVFEYLLGPAAYSHITLGFKFYFYDTLWFFLSTMAVLYFLLCFGKGLNRLASVWLVFCWYIFVLSIGSYLGVFRLLKEFFLLGALISSFLFTGRLSYMGSHAVYLSGRLTLFALIAFYFIWYCLIRYPWMFGHIESYIWNSRLALEPGDVFSADLKQFVSNEAPRSSDGAAMTDLVGIEPNPGPGSEDEDDFSFTPSSGKCWNCKKEGHQIKSCPTMTEAQKKRHFKQKRNAHARARKGNGLQAEIDRGLAQHAEEKDEENQLPSGPATTDSSRTSTSDEPPRPAAPAVPAPAKVIIQSTPGTNQDVCPHGRIVHQKGEFLKFVTFGPLLKSKEALVAHHFIKVLCPVFLTLLAIIVDEMFLVFSTRVFQVLASASILAYSIFICVVQAYDPAIFYCETTFKCVDYGIVQVEDSRVDYHLNTPLLHLQYLKAGLMIQTREFDYFGILRCVRISELEVSLEAYFQVFNPAYSLSTSGLDLMTRRLERLQTVNLDRYSRDTIMFNTSHLLLLAFASNLYGKRILLSDSSFASGPAPSLVQVRSY